MTVVFGCEMYKVKMRSGSSLCRHSCDATGVYMLSIGNHPVRKVVVIR